MQNGLRDNLRNWNNCTEGILQLAQQQNRRVVGAQAAESQERNTLVGPRGVEYLR